MWTDKWRIARLIVLIAAIVMIIVSSPTGFTYAMADDGTKQTTADESTKEKKDKNADTNNNDNPQAVVNPEDILEENAPVTRGNASSDTVKTSGQMDFYTIRSANNQTYYLVIDHSGAVDNVYLLSTIDENDLENFVDSGNARDGGLVVLPDSKSDGGNEQADIDAPSDKDSASQGEDSHNKGNSKTAGIASLAIIAGAGVAGIVAFMRKRKKSRSEEEYADENLEYDDGIRSKTDDEDY